MLNVSNPIKTSFAFCIFISNFSLSEHVELSNPVPRLLTDRNTPAFTRIAQLNLMQREALLWLHRLSRVSCSDSANRRSVNHIVPNADASTRQLPCINVEAETSGHQHGASRQFILSSGVEVWSRYDDCVGREKRPDLVSVIVSGDIVPQSF